MTKLRTLTLLVVALLLLWVLVPLLFVADEQTGFVIALSGVLTTFAAPLFLPLVRRVALRRGATARGWIYRGKDPELVGRYPMPVRTWGDNEALRVVRGAHEGRDFTAWEHVSSPSSSGDGGGWTTFAVVALTPPGGPLPDLAVVPRRRAECWDRHVEGLEVDDERLRRRFRTTTARPGAVEEVLTPEVVSLLLTRRHEAWLVHDGTWLFLTRGGLWIRDLERTLRHADRLAAVVEPVTRG